MHDTNLSSSSFSFGYLFDNTNKKSFMHIKYHLMRNAKRKNNDSHNFFFKKKQEPKIQSLRDFLGFILDHP